MTYTQILNKIIARHDLTTDEMTATMDDLMQGRLTPPQIAALITALRMKGESVDEISAAAAIMRHHAASIDVTATDLVDTCGTGGDGANTFNISTVAAIIAAGTGVVIAKHGNRSVSSKCGSADVLAALGVNITIAPQAVAACIDSVGIGFLFAPTWHPAMKHAVGPRKELGIRTIFNMLGPLSNPAGARRQLLGVYATELTATFAAVLKQLGSERALVVHGADGIDEISISGTTRISELKDGTIRTYDFDPLLYIDRYQSLDAVRGGDAEENATRIHAVLSGEDSAYTDIAVLNGAAAIYVAGNTDDFAGAVDAARDAVLSGRAKQKLNELIAVTNDD